MSGLVARIAEMNEIAERSPGFVWRLAGVQVAAEDLRAFEDYIVPFDPALIFYNMSVWESVEHLREYAFESRHREMLHGRRAWIEESVRPQVVMWWVPERHRPTVGESAERFHALHTQGPTPFAFSLQRTFPPPE